MSGTRDLYQELGTKKVYYLENTIIFDCFDPLEFIADSEWHSSRYSNCNRQLSNVNGTLVPRVFLT